MAGDRRKPWTTPARSLILFRVEGGRWRFAVHSERGILDGHLGHLGDGATVEEAQRALMDTVQDLTSLTYTATWSSDRPDWWTAELVQIQG